jgi:PleD family two-component response regulator
VLDQDAQSLERIRRYAARRFNVHATAEADEALTEAARRSFAVVVLNVLLRGELNSFEVVRRLRALPAFDAAIVGLVEEISPAADDLMRRAGFDGLIATPCTQEEFLHGVARARIA